MKEQYFRIAKLMADSLITPLSDEEKRELEQWRESSIEREELYQFLMDRHNLEGEFIYSKRFERRVQWEFLLAKKNRVIRKRRFMHFMGYAAGVILLFVFGILLSHKGDDVSMELGVDNSLFSGTVLLLPDGDVIDLEQQKGNIEMATNKTLVFNEKDKVVYSDTVLNESAGIIHNEIFVPRGKNYQVELSDGTLVHLNSETWMRFPVIFEGGIREVEIIGEGFFDVISDEEKPFIVKTGLYDIEVLGTKFNVSNYDNDKFSRTVLAEGAIRIISEYKDYVLKPNQLFEYDISDDSFFIESVDASYFTAWKDGEFKFLDEPIESIMNVIGRCYNMDILFEDDEVKELVFTMFFRKYASVDTVINVLNGYEKIHIEKNRQLLKIKKCR